MERDIYLQYRKQFTEKNIIHPQILYEYYQDHNTKEEYDVEPTAFEYYFSEHLRRLNEKAQQYPFARLGDALREMYGRIFTHMDKKYHVSILTNNNQILKIY